MLVEGAQRDSAEKPSELRLYESADLWNPRQI